MESEDTITFCNSNLFSSSFAHLEEMRKNGELCDLQMQIQGVSLTAHRAILAAGIPYFRTLFSDLETEGTHISLEELDPIMLESVINYAYSGTINISVGTVRSVLQVSQILQLKEVSDACVEFLAKRLLIGNVLEVYNLGNSLNKSNLTGKCIQFIQENFEEFSKTDDFRSLSGSCIKEIILSDELNVQNEKIVVEAVLSWVRNSPLERHAVLPELLSEIRMIYLPVDYLTERLSSDELITNSLPCKNLIDEVANCHLSKKNIHFLNFKTASRKYSIQPGIYAISRSGYYEHFIYHNGFCDVTWRHITTSHTKQRDAVSNVVAVNGKLYMFFREIIQTFNPKTQEWQQLKATHMGLGGAAVVTHGNIIYCFGSNDVEFETKVRRFDTEEEKWLTDKYMNNPRSYTAAATLGESIYVTGGYSQGMHHSTAEKYDTITEKLSEIAGLLTPRRRHGCISINGKIFVFGGNARGDVLRSGEVYDPHTNKWSFVSPMGCERFLFSLVHHNNEIYALGGLTKHSKYNFEVEIYDPESDKWRSDGKVNLTFNNAVSMPIHGN